MDGAGQQKRRPLGVMASSSSSTLAAARVGPNPLAELTDRVKSLEAGLRMWLAKQPTHVEAAASTALGAVQGGALGGLMGTLAPDGGSGLPMPQPPSGVDPKAMASFKQAQVRPFFPSPISLPSQEHFYFILFLDKRPSPAFIESQSSVQPAGDTISLPSQEH
jgi:hypothetical protein